MERSALIGGGALVVLLGVVFGLFVSFNLPSDELETDGSVEPASAEAGEQVAAGRHAIPAAPTQAAVADTEGDLSVGTEPAPPDEGAPVDWAEFRQRREAEIQARAYDVLDQFLTRRTTAQATEVRDAVDHMFATAAAIRLDMHNRVITPRESREEMARLRTDTARAVTDAVGPEGLRMLRDDLRAADASIF